MMEAVRAYPDVAGFITLLAVRTAYAAAAPITRDPIPEPIVKRGIAVEINNYDVVCRFNELLYIIQFWVSAKFARNGGLWPCDGHRDLPAAGVLWANEGNR